MVIWKVFEKEVHIISDKGLLIFDEYGFAKNHNINSYHADEYRLIIDEKEVVYKDCMIYGMDGDIDVIYCKAVKQKFGKISCNNYFIIIYGKKSHTQTTIWFQEFFNHKGDFIRYYTEAHHENV